MVVCCKLKLITCGNSRVGKSCIIKRYCEHRFTEKYNPTLGVDFGSVLVDINNTDIRIEVFDFSGDPLFYEVRNEFYHDAVAVLLVYDVNSRQSLLALDAWQNELMRHHTNISNVMVMVCANKIDSYSNDVALVKDGQTWSLARGYLFADVSASTGRNIDVMFKTLLLSSMMTALDNPSIAKGPEQPSMINEQLEAIQQLNQGQSNYERLGLGPNATRDEIVKAYRRLAVLLHPDKSQVKGTDEAFKRLVNAKTALLIDMIL